MQTIALQQTANQSFSVTLDNNQWNITLKATNGVMSVTLILNNVTVISNMRCVAGTLLIPSKYQESGNFLITTANFDLPDYSQFNATQFLIYISAVELEVLRLPPALPIKASDFNSIAALPLRFAPDGYVLA